MASLLPIVLAADNFPPHPGLYPSFHPSTEERYIPFHLTFPDHHRGLPPVGLLRPEVVAEMQADERAPDTCPWQFHYVARPSDEKGDVQGGGELTLEVECVFFADWVVQLGSDGMGRVMNDAAEKWKANGKFSDPLGGWRNEHYTVYAHPSSSGLKGYDPSEPFSNRAFPLERSACAVFGFATNGIHLTAYEGQGKEMKIWVPRRSATKATWPSRLDNSVAGGIVDGMTPFESVIKECDEEASLPETLVRSRAKCTGVVTYFYITETGYLQPEIEYLYDLQLPPQDSSEYVRLMPHDDEVDSFALLSVPEVLTALHSGEFKPNCGLVLVDFLIRHGFVLPETEPNFLEIRWRMARRLGIAVPA